MEKMSEVEKMRAEFEAWWVSRPHRKQPERFQNGDYMAPAVLSAWEAWQASRAALVVEMPSEEAVPPFPLGHRSRQWPLAWNTALSECRAAIEAAGVRIRA